MRSLSIRTKLTAVITLLIAFISAFIFVYFPARLEQASRRALVAKARSIADMTAFSVSPALYFEDAEGMSQAFRGARQNRDLAYLVLLNASGEVKAAFNPDRAEREHYLASRDNDHVAPDGSLLEIMTPVTFNGARIGELYLGLSLAEVQARIAESRLTIGLVSLLVFLVGIGVVFGVSVVLIRPLHRIVETVEQISRGDLTQRAPVSTGDEVGRLAMSFNRMVGELQQQFARISLLNQVTRSVAERQDMGSMFRVVLHRLEDHLPVDFGCIHVVSDDENLLTVAALGPRSREIALAAGLTGGGAFSAETAGLSPCLRGETIHAPRTAQADAPALRDLVRAGMGSGLAVPLMAEGRAFGVLIVARQEREGFSEAEAEFLRAMNEHVALAARHARLREDLQRTYDQLRKTQQDAMQQERLRALGQMASGIVHDVNNALSPITGFVELLMLTEPNLSDRARKYLKTIQTAATDIAHIVARMREFYRKRIGQEILLPVDLNRLVQEVMDMTRPRWRDIPLEQGIMIETETAFQKGLPPMTGIESEIREALTNLVFNAVDAMPQGGRLTIKTRVEQGGRGAEEMERKEAISPVPPLPGPSAVVLEVRDTGVGMDEETRRRCLEPFFSTKGERGTGLGLAMVFGVMQRHEGKVDIQSAQGVGTTVRLLFPVQSATERKDAASDGAGQGAQRVRILFIDDEPLLRDLVRDMLGVDGHAVEVADGGGTGLDAFRAARSRGAPFEVVITDLGMPYVDGREVARTVKRESPATPVILLTGWGARMDAEGDIPSEVDAILSKPPKLPELRKALVEVLAKKA